MTPYTNGALLNVGTLIYMVHEFEKKNLLQVTTQAAKEIGYKTISAYAFMVLVVIAIVVTFILAQHQQDIREHAAGTTGLTVDVTHPIHPFSNQMLGQALVNWEHSWGRPFPNSVPGLSTAMKEAHVGIIRYAGGLWANSVGFDPTKKQITPYTAWVKNGLTYYFDYGTDEIDNVQTFAKTIGADIILQVNISNNDPDMWASLVKYANGYDPVNKTYSKYPIKYWEFGNELDFDTDHRMTAAVYATRLIPYEQKMRAMDPNIQFFGAAQAYSVPQTGNNSTLSDFFTIPITAAHTAGMDLDAATYHWYQTCNSTSIADILRYRWYNSDNVTPIDPKVWNNSYSRYWADYIPQAVKSGPLSPYPSMRQGMTELNADACNADNPLNGNHIGALWLSDVLGRLAYNGLDFATIWEGYGGQAYGVLYADNPDAPQKIFARPTYDAYLMYAKYFGDQLVQSNSYKNDDISIWASTDSKDPGKLKLRVTNFTPNAISTPVTITGFTAGSGQVYQLTSTNPTDLNAASALSSAPTSINGVKIDAMNVASSVQSIVPMQISVNGNSFTYSFPAYSSTAIVLSSTNGSTPTTTTTPPTSTPTPTSALTPTTIPFSPTPKPTTTPSVPTPTPLPPTPTLKPFNIADMNHDGKVDAQDLSYLLTRWQTSDNLADLNKDNIVTILDLSIMLSNWGK